MRRLSKKFTHNLRSEEYGVTTVMTAVMMVVLLGFAALSIDVGKLYWEKAQLQNGADAGALALAAICGKNISDPQCNSGSTIISQLANKNANDSSSRVQSASVNAANKKAVVTTSAAESGAPLNKVSTWFASILDPAFSNMEVRASASAGWGSVKSLTAKFPLTFSLCEVDSAPTYDGSLQYLMSKGITGKKGKKDPDACHSNSAGHEIPGGFGWLIQDPVASCSAKTSIGSWAASEPGNSLGKGCDTRLAQWKAELLAGKKVIVLLPVFDDATGNGANGAFRIHGYAAVDIRGWTFTGGNQYLPLEAQLVLTAGGHNSNSTSGFVGKFIRYVFEDEDAEFGGGGFDYGSNLVQLTD